MSVNACRRASWRIVLVQACIALLSVACGGGGDDDTVLAAEEEAQSRATASFHSATQNASGFRRVPICMDGSPQCPGGPVTQ
jgi:hypothetical protein